MADQQPKAEGKPTQFPDAIRIPAGYVAGSSGDKAAKIQAKFAPIFGGTPESPVTVHVRNQVTFAFLTTDPYDTLYFPKGHVQEGKSRYDWIKISDNPEVFYGYKVKEETEE